METNEIEIKKPSPTVLILRLGSAAAAAFIFVMYVLKHAAEYKPVHFILPFVSLALFTAILLISMPKLVAIFSGKADAGTGEKADRRKLFQIMLAALGVHLFTMILGVLICSSLNPSLDAKTLWNYAWMKQNTDAGHYLSIAENWYVREGDNRLLIVFFPMLPVLIKAFNLVFHNSFVSAQVINAIATVGASGMTYLTLTDVLGERRSRAAAFIAILLPGAIFMNSPMSEPLFLLFTISAFYFMQKKRFLLSGIFVALSGFTRSLGVISAVPLALVGLNELIALIKAKKNWGKTLALLLLGLAVSTFGTLGYLFINYSIHGDPFKFLEYQWSNWYQRSCPFFDTPRYVFSYAVSAFKSGDSTFRALWLPQLIAIFGSLVLMIRASRKLPASYTVYFLCYYAVSIGCTWLLSSVRYLSAAVPLIAAFGLICDKKWKTAIVFVLLAAVYVIYTIMYMKGFGVY
ncbi:MAG: hypothetical protein K6F68_09190 [Clostridiales bacterium]|nr:hypothetical protein [Clostridiales bacterium]